MIDGHWVGWKALGAYGSSNRRAGLVAEVSPLDLRVDIETVEPASGELDDITFTANVKNVWRPLRITIGAGTPSDDPAETTISFVTGGGSTLRDVETPRLVEYWIASDNDTLYARPSARVIGASVRALASHTVTTFGETYSSNTANVGLCEQSGPETWQQTIGVCDFHDEWFAPPGERTFRVYAEAMAMGPGNEEALFPDRPPLIQPGVDNALREYTTRMLVIDMG
jgi:hypothetical protein